MNSFLKYVHCSHEIMASMLQFYEQQLSMTESMLQTWIDHKQRLENEDVPDLLVIEEANSIIRHLRQLQAELIVLIAAEERRLEPEQPGLED